MNKNKKVDKNAEKLLELEENWKRALADYKNLEKRSGEEKAAMVDFANLVLMEKLLPVLDNFLMIEKHTDDMGIKMSVREFVNTLQSAGLKNIDVSEGEDFDPKIMDAVETAAGHENKVLSVIRGGYFFKDKLVRPVSVKVGRGNKSHDQKEKK